MKITKSQLKQLIKEELLEVLSREDARVMATFSPTYHEKAGTLQAQEEAEKKAEEERMRPFVDAGRITQEAYDNFVARITKRYEGELEEIKDEIADAFIERSEQPGAKYQNISDWASAHADSLLNMMRMGHKNLPDWLEDLLIQPEVDPEMTSKYLSKFLSEQVMEYLVREELKAVLTHEKIEKRGNKHVVTTDDGSKTLGTHDTEKEAQAQLYAIHKSQEEQGEK